jgi:uncharacterized protein (TIGR02145 family)
MKQLLSLLLVVCLGTLASAQIPNYVPTNGLVGWWPFNGNANDESGNGNHGTVNGATLAADRFGNPGKAYSFDGNDKIEVNSNPMFDFQDFSLSIWVYSYSTSIQVLVTKSEWNNASFETFNLSRNSNIWKSQIKNNSNCIAGNGWVVSNPNSTINDTVVKWNHVIVTFSGNQLKIYLNGALISNTNASKNLDICSGGQLRFGAHWLSHPLFFIGKLDDISIYNRGLSPTEIISLSCNKKPAFTAQPQNKSVDQGQTTTFAVQVDSAAKFQWQMNLGLGAGWVSIPQSSLFSGDTTATLSVHGRSTIDGAQFRCIATACQNDTSNAATLTVTSTSSILGSVAGVPGKINYQGAAMDSLGKPMKNQTIALKLSVLDSSSTGAASFVETHSTPTNGSGLFTLQIGGGTSVTGTFDSIPWANGRNKYLKTEVNQNGTWINLGTSQLVSVPYALVSGYSQNSGSSATLRDSLGNAYQIKTVNGQPVLVSAPGNVSAPASFACGQAVTYAGETYPTVQIGTQCWFQKNMNAGTMVNGMNSQINNLIIEKYCKNNDSMNCRLYGGYYQWAEAIQYQNNSSNGTIASPSLNGNIKGICPTGWHIPSNQDWQSLELFLGGSNQCGGKLKSISNSWNNPNSGANNSSSFFAEPYGNRGTNGFYSNWGDYAFFWTSTEFSQGASVSRTLSFDTNTCDNNNDNKNLGFSVRCLKD